MSPKTSFAAITLALAGCGGGTVMHLGDTANAGGSSGAGGETAGSGGQTLSGAGGGGLGSGGSSMTMGADAGMASACTPNAGTSVPLAMTKLEYDHTVRDLLGDTSAPATKFSPDVAEVGFLREAAPVDMLRSMQYAQAASDLALAAEGLLVQGHASQILPCDQAAIGEDACATQFIESFGRRAFRRPLTAAELAEMQQVYQKDKVANDFVHAIRFVIETMLGSPRFYEIQSKGTAPGLAALDPFQLASRLSYFIYRSMPDNQLLDAAAGGKLVTKADVESQTRRMLADPKAHDGILDFFSEWLSLDRLSMMTKDPTVLANFDSVRDDMVSETTKFTESIFFTTGRFQSLFSGSQTWINGPLADLYGQPGVVGSAFQQVQLNPKIRSGLLTQASFLSIAAGVDAGSPTLRGLFVREKVLCNQVPPPPPNLANLPPIAPGQTNRERYEAAMISPACAACHHMLDPIGYGLESFDAVGRYRTIDNGTPVDASGEIVNASGIEGPFLGAVELGNKLASSDLVQTCAAKQWFRFALSRSETDEDTCSVDAATHTLQSSGDLRELVVAVTTSDSFRYVRW